MSRCTLTHALDNVPGAAIPIVHRVIEVHDECARRMKLSLTSRPPVDLDSPPSTLVATSSGVQEQWIRASIRLHPAQLAVTKGDNNPTDDIGLYNGVQYLRRSNMCASLAVTRSDYSALAKSLATCPTSAT